MKTVGTYEFDDIPAFVDELVYGMLRHGNFVYNVTDFVDDGGKHFIVHNKPLDERQLRQISAGLGRKRK